MLPITITAHAFLNSELDADMLKEVADAVAKTRESLYRIRRVKSDTGVVAVHAALRQLVGEPEDEQTLLEMDRPVNDLADILEQLLTDYAAALSRLATFATAPLDPRAEYERLMTSAEAALSPFSSRSDGPQRARAFVMLAESRLRTAEGS